ncbi:pygopus homolog 1 [Triplophysa rosa]|uniref:Pygopus-like protein 1 n=1 Tax=Triplophysa rosa TaxID=992332 RepID=A0A9W7TUB0_TRIRA|nr:pygopus homolog 1 [Triplophysa rosa]KAI7802628.1 putative pygopus-like protein 1 [Triplophysa rosa]
MSTEPDKDSFSLKRHRGGEGGLGDVFGSSGLLVGSPEKRRRKSSTQALSFSPLSEYAPPLNPSSNHLIASNPFDDRYSLPSVKSLPSANPHFSPSHYSGFRGYGTPRMAPHTGNRTPSHSPYQMRNQPHPFSQNPTGMGFHRAPGFNYGHPENPNYGHSMGQPFRPGPGENVNPQNPHQNLNHSNSPDGVPRFGPDGNAKTTPDMSPKLSQQQNNFSRSGTPKQDPSDTISKNTTRNPSPRKRSQNCEDGTAELGAKGRGNTPGVEKLNGVLHSNTEALKWSPRPENTQTDKARRGSRNKVESRSVRRSASSEPIYPCGICLSEVNDDQEAILCEASCQKWFHRVCTGMTETAYNLLTAETSAVWGCDACMEDKGAQLLKTRDAPGTPSVTSDGQS